MSKNSQIPKNKNSKTSPDRWLYDHESIFPNGKNPWTDLYTGSVTQKIGIIIKVTTNDDLFDLRLHLANAAEDSFKTFQFVGGPASPSKKRNWRAKAISQALSLKRTLVGSSDNYSTVSLKKEDGKGVTITPSSVVGNKVQSVISELEDLTGLLEQVEDSSHKKPLLDEDGKPFPTQHSQYLQYVVDQMTKVFIKFCGLESVKRSSDDEGTYGVFPDFIRIAAAPCLMAFYQRYADDLERPFLLNAQIQDAVKKASNIR